MYCTAVDLVEAVSTSGKTHNREVYYRMPFKFGQKLGKRTRYKTLKFTFFELSLNLRSEMARQGRFDPLSNRRQGLKIRRIAGCRAMGGSVWQERNPTRYVI
jgi:hypothetical protein